VKQITTSAAAVDLNVTLNPADTVLGASRLGGLALWWNSFRFVKFAVDVLPNSSNVEALLVGGYTDDVLTSTGPATVQDLLQLACKVYQTPNQSVPCRLWVPRSYLLRNTLKWWKCRAATDSFEGNQGQCVFLTSAPVTGSFNFVFSGTIEFKDPLGSSDEAPRLDPYVPPVPTWQVVEIQPPEEEQKEKSSTLMIRDRRSASLPPVLERKAR